MSIDLTDLNNWPDGAEACIDGLFIKWIDGSEYYFIEGSDYWSISGYPWSLNIYKSSGRHNIIMRPQESKKYQPEIDEICLGNIRNDSGNYLYIEVKPLYNLGSEWAVQCVATSKLSYCDEFKPLKSKESEEFHLAVVDACMGIHNDDFNIDEIANALYDAGFTVPKEDKK